MTSLFLIFPAVESKSALECQEAAYAALADLRFHGHTEASPVVRGHPTLDAYCVEVPLRSKSMCRKAAGIVRHHWPTAKINMRTVEEVEL